MAIHAELETEIVDAREQTLPHRVQLWNLPSILKRYSITLSGARTGGPRRPALRAYFPAAPALPVSVRAPVVISAIPLASPIRAYTHRMVFGGLRDALEHELGRGSFGSTSAFIGTELALVVSLYADVSRVFSVLIEDSTPVETGSHIRDLLVDAKDDRALQKIGESIPANLRTILPWNIAGLPRAIAKVSIVLALLSLTGDVDRRSVARAAKKSTLESVRLWSDSEQAIRATQTTPIVASAIDDPSLSKEGARALNALAREGLRRAVTRRDARRLSERWMDDAIGVGRNALASDRVVVEAESREFQLSGKEALVALGAAAGIVLAIAQLKKTKLETKNQLLVGEKTKLEIHKLDLETKKITEDLRNSRRDSRSQ